ncbi:hypothetical protein V1477_000317 [Vespula maculifrons]|uniref:Uncharacterized protein n=1 Tax=Vespula maculifrons TaxID=7453 RepID=A0ABD2D2K7_VESMC
MCKQCVFLCGYVIGNLFKFLTFVYIRHRPRRGYRSQEEF